MHKRLTLNNNHTLPVLGLGTWKSPTDKAGQAVQFALENGYTHIDCAHIYGNEPEIGQIFAQVFGSKKIKRADVFITSKLWNTNHHPSNVENACRQTLADLQLEYLDLYLMHWGIAFAHGSDPKPKDDQGMIKTEPVSVQETWQAMENLVKQGLVKSIGVSNFTVPILIDLLTYARITPVTNQVEIHPYNSQPELVEYCYRKQITVTAYSPLGSSGDSINRPLNNKTVLEIAQAHQKTPAQVLIRWALQRGLVVIPKSVTPERILENANVFDFELSSSDMKRINNLNKNLRFIDPVSTWGIPYFK